MEPVGHHCFSAAGSCVDGGCNSDAQLFFMGSEKKPLILAEPQYCISIHALKQVEYHISDSK